MLKNKKMPLETFLKIREEVLQGWPTGSDEALKLEESVKTLKAVPEHKNFAKKLRWAKKEGITSFNLEQGSRSSMNTSSY
jgi:methylaspartate mutase epsilon subunit